MLTKIVVPCVVNGLGELQCEKSSIHVQAKSAKLGTSCVGYKSSHSKRRGRRVVEYIGKVLPGKNRILVKGEEGGGSILGNGWIYHECSIDIVLKIDKHVRCIAEQGEVVKGGSPDAKGSLRRSRH